MDFKNNNMMLHDENINYTILKEQDIQKRQETAISEISTVLQLSNETACLLLIYYNWNVCKVHEEWFSDEEKVRKAVGIVLDKPKIPFQGNENLSCGICFEKYSYENLHCVGCGHLFCDSCWKNYITTTINDGPACLYLWCPEPDCSAAVGPDMVDKLVKDENKAKYHKFIIRSYVESSRRIKWCPSPGCDSAVEFGIGSGSYDVICDCLYKFCWNCKEEAHKPLDCETAAKWNMKNSVESENTEWILANTKPCPMCKRPIEKYGASCNHITCAPPCNFHFCWLCRGPWSDVIAHGCAKGPGQVNVAKLYLEKYPYYYENWVSKNASMQKALPDLNEIKRVHFKKIDEVQRQDIIRPMFITEAWQQIVECTRVLKWSCAYDYHNFSEQNMNSKKLSFKRLQFEARSNLESLQFCALKELMTYINSDEPSNIMKNDDFSEFRKYLVCLTSETRTHIEYFVRVLENGLPDVINSKARKLQAQETEGSCHKRFKTMLESVIYSLD